MSKCPNCQRETLRTIDWACHLCGYPLVLSTYGKIDKTYKQIREERLHKKKTVYQDTEYEESAESTEKYNERKLEFEMGIQKIPSFNPQYKTRSTDDYKHDTIEEIEESNITPDLDEESGVEKVIPESTVITTPEAVSDEEPQSQSLSESEPELVEQIEPDLKTAPEIREIKAGTDSIPETANTIESVPVEEQEVIQSTPVLPPADLELTIEVILSEYASNDVEANAKFVNKIIKLTGIAAAIDIKEVLAVHYIRMTDSAMDVMQSVQCIFDKKYAEVLRGIQKGQTITIHGKYTGSLIAMRMADCVLV